MKRVFVLGGTKPGYHKRYLRAIGVLSQLFDEVYYQFADYRDGIPFELPRNVYPVPVSIGKNQLKSKKRWEFEKKILEIFDEFGRGNNVYILDFLRFSPLLPFVRAGRVVFETFEYYPAGVLYGLKNYALGKLKEWVLLPIYVRMLELSDGIVATAPRDIFPLNKVRPDVYAKVHFIPNLASLMIRPLPLEDRRKVLCFGATRKMSLERVKMVVSIWERHGYRFDVFGGVRYEEPISGEYHGFMPYEDYVRVLSGCTWIVLSNFFPGYSPNINTIWSLPNKLFDALGAGTPVMVHKDNVAMAELVKRYGVGVVYGDDVDESFYHVAMENYHNYLENIRRYQRYFIWTLQKERAYKEFLVRCYRL